MKSLCVYCGSRPGADPAYQASAEAIGREAARRDWRIVYGGGKLGLMGATAGAARDAGGRVFGIIPDFLVEMEGVLPGVDHVVVKTMHERKMMMFEESDAFLTLPGGIGTLEELIELMSWTRLGLHRKPIVILNINGFWTPLKHVFEHLVEQKLAAPEIVDDVIWVDHPEEVFPAVERRSLSALI